MELDKELRPIISKYTDFVDFIRDMIAYRKKTERSFSVLSASKNLRKMSPALVTLILQRKRNLTLDRVDEMAKLLKLSAPEKYYLKDWLDSKAPSYMDSNAFKASDMRDRREVSSHILNDWINVYVKDCFQIPEVRQNPQLVYRYLAHLSTHKRIDRAIQFLLKEGYLKKESDEQIAVESPLMVAQTQVSDRKIRDFHKGALGIARSAVDLFPVQERFANTMLIPLNKKKYTELLELIQDFAEKLKNFAADIDNQPQSYEVSQRLYQIIINASPVGGKQE